MFFTDRTAKAAKDEQGKTIKDKDGKTIYEEKQRSRPICKQYTVFNVEQADGLELKPREGQVRPEWDAHRDAEKVIAASGPTVEHVAGIAPTTGSPRTRWCSRSRVNSQRGTGTTRRRFTSAAIRPATRIAWTATTLKDGMADGFGSAEYAREELRAEISAMMTGERVGVGHDPQRGAAYVENWVAVLEKDPHEIHRAARGRAEDERLPHGPRYRARG